MVGVQKRLRLLKARLFNIRFGLGAAVLPNHITRLDLQLCHNEAINVGSWDFRRLMLPRLKFHNPTIPMTVRLHDHSAILSVYKQKNGDNSPPDTVPEPRTVRERDETLPHIMTQDPKPELKDDETIVEIDMNNRNGEDIWNEFSTLTGAVVIQPTPAEMEELQNLVVMKRRTDKDAERGRQIQAAKLKEEMILRQAKGEVDASAM